MLDERYKKTPYYVAALIFLVAEAVLYFLFMRIDLLDTGDSPIMLKYASIILCLCFAAFLLRSDNADSAYIPAAMVFTLLADLFLLVRGDNFILGLCSFTLVQIIYFLRIYRQKGRKPYLSALVRLAICAAVILVLGLVELLDGTIAVAAVYFINLAINALESFLYCKGNKKLLIFGIALTLFLGCDVNVMLYNARYLFVFSDRFINTAYILMWTFYLPSQVLIVLSAAVKGASVKKTSEELIENEN